MRFAFTIDRKLLKETFIHGQRRAVGRQEVDPSHEQPQITHLLRVACRRCSGTVEISEGRSIRLYGQDAIWRDVGQCLLDNTCLLLMVASTKTAVAVIRLTASGWRRSIIQPSLGGDRSPGHYGEAARCTGNYASLLRSKPAAPSQETSGNLSRCLSKVMG